MNGQTLNILLVEDDPIDVKNIQRAFEKANMSAHFIVTENGEQALELLNQSVNSEDPSQLPHIILLDLNMPRMNGIEFLQEIRKNQTLAKIPVFIISAYDDQQSVDAAYKEHVAGYIAKPLTFDNFSKTIAKFKDYLDITKLPNTKK